MASSGRPEDVRAAMADFVTAAHEAYLSAVHVLPPGEQARMPLLVAGDFTVVAAGARNLHVLATTQPLPAPRGPEVQVEGGLDGLRWTLRFFDPVVLPGLGLVDESAGARPEDVRRLLGIHDVLYHLVVQPGSQLTTHHAMHLGAGLAGSHAARARDLEVLRAQAPHRVELVDELAAALTGGLPRAAALLAGAIAPYDEAVASLARQARDTAPDPARVLATVLGAVREGATRAAG